MARSVKGEVRRLADAFPVAEAERASKHIDGTIQAQRHQLETLDGYLKDNRELSKLVQDLPNKTSHNIMVPFGKAAFFPGRLVHTNEFMVLLGEGYYSECSAKQTLEILGRRGKFLESKIAGVKSQLADLQAESVFFSDTLGEAAAGVVEIREEYIESSSSEMPPNAVAGPSKPSECYVKGSVPEDKAGSAVPAIIETLDEDKEYERIMARLTELEFAEAAAEKEENSDSENEYSLNWSLEEGEQVHSSILATARELGEHTKSLEQDEEEDAVRNPKTQQSFMRSNLLPQRLQNAGNIQVRAAGSFQNQYSLPSKADENTAVNGSIATIGNKVGAKSSDCGPIIRGPGDLLKFEEWRRQKLEKDCALQLAQNDKKGGTPLLPTEGTERKERTEREQSGKKASAQNPPSFEGTVQKEELQKSGGTFRSQKAFTGAVLERTGPSLPADNISKTQTQTQTRPTSRFKMRQSGQ